MDPTPILRHAAQVADEACWIVDPTAKEVRQISLHSPPNYILTQVRAQLSWYTRRATVSAVYLAAELHQLTSPKTAESFLDYLLENSGTAEKAVQETVLYGEFIFKSWRGILKSSGIL